MRNSFPLVMSSALFPEPELRNPLKRDYDDQCARLCYGVYPLFDEVLTGFQGVREYLVEVPEEGETQA